MIAGMAVTFLSVAPRGLNFKGRLLALPANNSKY